MKKVLYFLGFKGQPYFKLGRSTLAGLKQRLDNHRENFDMEMEHVTVLSATSNDVIIAMEMQLKAEYPGEGVPEDLQGLHGGTELRHIRWFLPMMDEVLQKQRKKPHLGLAFIDYHSIAANPSRMNTLLLQHAKEKEQKKIQKEKKVDNRCYQQNLAGVKAIRETLVSFTKRMQRIKYVPASRSGQRAPYILIRIKRVEDLDDWDRSEGLRMGRDNRLNDEMSTLVRLIRMNYCDTNNGLLAGSIIDIISSPRIVRGRRVSDVCLLCKLDYGKYPMVRKSFASLKSALESLPAPKINFDQWLVN